jgi:hypothetical protein
MRLRRFETEFEGMAGDGPDQELPIIAAFIALASYTFGPRR